MSRSTDEVFESHLRLRLEGKVEEDIEQNFSPDVVLISSIKRLTGHDGIRESAQDLQHDVGDAKFTYVRKVVEGEFAYLIWKAESDTVKVEHGVDSFLIRNGKILVQSVYYAVEEK